MLKTPHLAFAFVSALSLGQLLWAAPGGRLLVGNPEAQHAEKDPSVRLGSAGTHHSWFFFSSGGGYHGGK
jgi:hypothetical protein